MWRNILIILVIPSFLLLYSANCFAHKVRIFAWGEGNIIYTESKFSGGKPAQKATVTVLNEKTGEQLLQGTTDQDGLFQFPLPSQKIPAINIVVNSGDGHKNNWLYELGDPVVEKEESDTVTASSSPAAVAVTEDTVTLIKEQLAEVIEASLEKKLSPIRRELAERSQQGPSIQDIFGGLGYILGLAGLAAYMKSKKQ